MRRLLGAGASTSGGASAGRRARTGAVALIVVGSAAIRIALGRHVIAPWIMVDELIYSELAKSLAASGHFQVRGVASNGYGFIYPALIAPAWKLFGAMPAVYAAAKVINAVVMSLAAVPAYLLARRLLAPGLSLCAAVLAVVIPPMLYTSELMTENAFYPLFLVVMWALVATLERPSWKRQVGVLLLCAVAFATRQQAVALIPAVAVAPAVYGLTARAVVRELRAWFTTYAILGACVVLALGGTVARGRSPLSLLGAYRAATSVPYSATSVLHYLLWHIAELDVALGVIPFVALLAVWMTPHGATTGARAFVAATVPVTILLIVEVAIFASTQSGRIEERNMFYVMPIALIALLSLAERDVITRRRAPLLAAALVGGVLPIALPLGRFINTSALSDTFGLLPIWWIQDRGITFATLHWIVPVIALAAAAAVVLVPRRGVMVLVGLVAAYFVVSSAVVQNGRHGIVQASAGSLWAGIRAPDRDWVDHAAGRDSTVSLVWVANPEAHPVYENEFFSRSIKTIYAVGHDIWTGGLPETELRERADGTLVDLDGVPPRFGRAVVPLSLSVGGKLLAKDVGAGLELLAINGTAIELSNTTGLYGDLWSHRRVSYLRRRCSGGFVSVVLQSDSKLFSSVNTVTAYEDGKRVAATAVSPTTPAKRFLVPLQGGPNAQCIVQFQVHTLHVPAQVEPGSTDTRALGMRFLSFDYLP